MNIFLFRKLIGFLSLTTTLSLLLSGCSISPKSQQAEMPTREANVFFNGIQGCLHNSTAGDISYQNVTGENDQIDEGTIDLNENRTNFASGSLHSGDEACFFSNPAQDNINVRFRVNLGTEVVYVTMKSGGNFTSSLEQPDFENIKEYRLDSDRKNQVDYNGRTYIFEPSGTLVKYKKFNAYTFTTYVYG